MAFLSLLLPLLSMVYRGRRSWHRRSTATRLAERHRSEFYDRAWQAAADELGERFHHFPKRRQPMQPQTPTLDLPKRGTGEKS